MNPELELILTSILVALPFEIFFGYYFISNWYDNRQKTEEVE